MVLLTVATACGSPELPQLCAAHGDSEGQLLVSCFDRYSDQPYTDAIAFSQVIAGTSGLVDRWQYGEALHFTDFNGDGRSDLCSARGNAEGHVDVACYNFDDGRFPETPSFSQTVTALTGWTGDWQYGEALHFTDFNGDDRTDLCAARGNAAGELEVLCVLRNADGFADSLSFEQTLPGKAGLVDRWQYGEALHFTDYNGDGRVDVCGAFGGAEGALEVYCFFRERGGSFPDAPSFQQAFTGTGGWTNRMQYGEPLRFTDFNDNGSMDLCGAHGIEGGRLQVGCFFQQGDGTLSASRASFLQILSSTTQWQGEWRYGEALHFTWPDR
jgi:hypothetical protein